jgi:hypothetical protein
LKRNALPPGDEISNTICLCLSAVKDVATANLQDHAQGRQGQLSSLPREKRFFRTTWLKVALADEVILFQLKMPTLKA